jgi:nucleotide-binding universal stress UspA family protein
MSSIKKILVPVDFSKCARNAMLFALEIAKSTTAEVHVLHIIHTHEHLGEDEFGGLWFDEYCIRRLHDLEKWVGRFIRNKKYANIMVTASYKVGDTVAQIEAFAKDNGCDLITMGTTGATGLKAKFIGSNAARMISNTKIPMLTVPEKAAFHKHTNYMFATDFNIDLDKYSWDVLKEVLKAQQVKLKVLHVIDGDGDEFSIKSIDDIKEKLEGISVQFYSKVAIDVIEEIGEYVNDNHIAGVIVVSHRHKLLYQMLFNSTSRMMVLGLNVPILVLHDREKA